MKKLFAYAAIALAGAFVFATYSDAKPGGFGGGGFKGKPFAKPHFAKLKFHSHHFALKHHLGHHHRFAHHHHKHQNFGFPGFYAWGAPYSYAAPQIVEVPQESDDVTGSTEPRRVSVWRGPESSGGCSVQSVTVPASQGGETTVRIIRC
jgi:hypothetical protein